MSVNVGTIGHVDHSKKVLVVDNGLTPARSLALLAAIVPGFAGMLPSLPAPKPARTQTAADLERIEAAVAKRQRRIERNKQRGDV